MKERRKAAGDSVSLRRRDPPRSFRSGEDGGRGKPSAENREIGAGSREPVLRLERENNYSRAVSPRGTTGIPDPISVAQNASGKKAK